MNNEHEQHDNNEHDAVNSHRLVIPTRLVEEVHTYEGNVITQKAVALFGAFVVTGLVATFAVTEISSNEIVPEPALVQQAITESAVPEPPHVQHPLENVKVIAEAAIVYDVNQDRILFGKNEDKKMRLASVTKMMTALLATESLSENSNVAVSAESLRIEGDSGLYANETWNVRDLIHFTMLTSSNDGANALAAAVGSLWQSTPSTQNESDQVLQFVNRMNFRADELGLDNTRYTNPTGLDDVSPGGLGTAHDTAKLLTYIWEHEPDALLYTNLEKMTFTSLDEFAHVAENTNETVNDIPGLLAGKTGYTDKAGGNLAIMYDAGLDHPIAIVVLGSTREGRFEDVETLVDATYSYLSSGWYEYETQVSGSTKNRSF